MLLGQLLIQEENLYWSCKSVFVTKFQRAYFRMYSNNNFFVNGIMEFFGLITVLQNNKQTNW